MSNALIVGISGAIGGAVAQACQERGLRVCGTSHSAKLAGEWSVTPVNLLDEDAIVQVVAELPVLDLVVFAQGIRPSTCLADMTAAHASNMLDVNITGTLLMLKHLVPKLSSGAAVVLIASSAATKGSYDPSYAAAKGALVALTKSLAKELKDKVRVNCISPGLVADSPVHRSMTPAHAAKHETRMFQSRLVAATDVAQLILSIYDNPSLNGCNIPIDCGYSD